MIHDGIFCYRYVQDISIELLKLSFDNSWYILKHGDSFPSSPSDVSRLAFSQVNFNFYAYKLDNRIFLFTVKIL